MTSLGDKGWFWIFTALIFAALGRWNIRRNVLSARSVSEEFSHAARRAAFAAVIAMLGCFIITNLFLKNMIARVRPYDAYEAVIPLIARPLDFSFPSGHTCLSFACAFVYRKMLPGWLGNTCLLLAVMIAFSRLYLGVHYPSDIFGGIAVACAVGWIAVTLTVRAEAKAGKKLG